jgi:hypothetical protein
MSSIARVLACAFLSEDCFARRSAVSTVDEIDSWSLVARKVLMGSVCTFS